MAIEIINGFQVIPNKEGDILGIESDRIYDCMKYALENNIKKIFVHGGDKYNLPNVNFLKEYDFFTHLVVNPGLLEIDISASHSLKKLRYLSLSNGKQQLDFSQFPELEEASIDWNDKLINFDKCNNLTRITIWKYKPKSKNIIELKGLRNLLFLKITESNIESLYGIENLSLLTQFEGYYLSKVKSLQKIELLSTTLKTLILDHCKSLTNFGQSLGTLTKLEKLILGDCGSLENLKFIRSMTSLRFFSFVGTTVEDGKLSYLKERSFEYIGFDDKRTYTHKMNEFNAVP